MGIKYRQYGENHIFEGKFSTKERFELLLPNCENGEEAPAKLTQPTFLWPSSTFLLLLLYYSSIKTVPAAAADVSMLPSLLLMTGAAARQARMGSHLFPPIYLSRPKKGHEKQGS